MAQDCEQGYSIIGLIATMYKGKDLIGRPIVTHDTGEEVGTVVDLISIEQNIGY